jgi:hypothetical protein
LEYLGSGLCTGEVAGTGFGFVRNISDPVQNAALASKIQDNWGSAIYYVYGLYYTSYNGAMAAWATLRLRRDFNLNRC